MGIKAFVYQSWVGGQATDKKRGQSDSFANSQSMDFRKSPSQISVLPGTRRTDGGVVTDLVQNEVMVTDGTIWAIGSSGNVYRVSPAGVWSLFGNIGSNGTYGINWRQDQDAIYIPGVDHVSSITSVSTNPILNVQFYSDSLSTFNNNANTTFNVNSNQIGSMQETAILTSYGESNTQQERFFQTDIQPIRSIGVYINKRGTGNWTLVVHDGLNNELGSVFEQNANLGNNRFNYFHFATPVQINVPTSNTASGTSSNVQTYHFHLTSTVADGSIASSVTNDLSSADMQLAANWLVNTKNGIHSQVTFQQFECITNGRYLSIWEPLGEPEPSNSEWQRQGLTFPSGYEGYGETVFNEYLAVATGLSTTGSGTAQQGIIFYWDGLSSTYNYFTRIPEGIPYSIHEYENALYYEAGGDWYVITSVNALPQKIRHLPAGDNIYAGTNTQTVVYPNMGTVRNGIHLLGWPSTTANTSLPYGVYSWGRVDTTQPNSFGYSYLLSTDDQFVSNSNNLTIGMVKNFGDILHISWRSGNKYGVDVVDGNSTPAAYSTVEQIIEDNKFVTKEKQASYVEASWLDIQDGVQIVLKYQINRGGWQYSERFSNSNLWSPDDVSNYARFDIGNDTQEERFNELQIGVDIYCDDTVTQAPVIIGLAAPFDTLDSETLI